MWIRSVTAHAFGAIEETTLEFGDDLNIIVGLNGTGKSTWHAAIYAALTGNPGDSAAPVDRRLRKRRPRSTDAWSVSAEIGREGGRTVRISQNLARPHDSSAVDQGTGVDLAPSIWSEDGLDATRWLGLDRRSFAATAYVEQAYGLLASPEDTSGKALQRAIASGGGEATVAEALDRIARHRRQVVGDATDPDSPIGRALTEVREAAAAQAELADLGRRHQAQRRVVELAEHDLARAREDLTAGQDAAARAAVAHLEAKLDEAVRAERAHAEAAALAAARPTTDPRVEEAAARYRAALSVPAVYATSPSPAPAVPPAGPAAGGWLVPGLVGLVGVAALAGSAVVSNLVGFVAGVVVLLAAALLAVRVVLGPVPPVSAPVLSGPVRPAEDLDQRRRDLRDALTAALAAAGVAVAADEDVMAALERYRRDAVPAVAGYAGPSVSEVEVRLEGACRHLAALQPPPAYGPPLSYGSPIGSYGPPAALGYGRVEARPEPTADLATLQSRYDAAERARSEAGVALDVIDQQLSLLTVDSAGHARATDSYERLRHLESIFREAATRLDSARASVHRTVADRLAFRVQDWLADVSDGRYTSVRIDPDTMTVYIAGPDDPEVDADEDSLGTSDVVRLLLRLALYHRERDGEPGPLLLDDVVTHSDPQRARRTVEILAKIAKRGHQVILFTTQEIAGCPATAHLVGTRQEPRYPDRP